MSHLVDPLQDAGKAAVADLLGPRGRLTAVANAMPCPIGTVFEWKKSGSIPTWRRDAVLDAARRLRLTLATETITYLADTTPAVSEGVTA